MSARRARENSTSTSQTNAGDINTGDSGPTDSQPADLAKLKRYFAEARDLTLVARTNSILAQDYYDSDQFTPQEKAALRERRQPPIIVNRIKPAISAFLGLCGDPAATHNALHDHLNSTGSPFDRPHHLQPAIRTKA